MKRPAPIRHVIRPIMAPKPIVRAGSAIAKTMRGHQSELGNSCWASGDFGDIPRHQRSENMGDLWDDVSNWTSTTLNKTLASASTSLQKSATKAVESYVLKLTGADGSTKSVNLSADQYAQYRQTGTVPPSVIPAGFVMQKSFFEEYKTPLMIAGGITLATILGLIVYKAVKK